MRKLLSWAHRSPSSRVAAPPTTWTYNFTDRPASYDPTLHFTARVQVTWQRTSDSTADPRTAARLIRTLINQCASSCDVLRPDAAEQDLAAALRTQLPLHGDGVEVVGGRVQLTVDEATHTAALQAERLRQEHAREETRRHQENIRDEARRRDEHAAEEARLRREYELDSLARRQARAREDFLRREILASPASARLYTLLERSADYWPRLGGPPAGTDLSSLVREVQQWHPQESWVTVAQLLHDFVLGLSLEGRKEFLTILANAVHVHGDEKRAQLLTNALGEQE